MSAVEEYLRYRNMGSAYNEEKLALADAALAAETARADRAEAALARKTQEWESRLHDYRREYDARKRAEAALEAIRARTRLCHPFPNIYALDIGKILARHDAGVKP